jgi:PHD/YefM family antitoxin component YafN of YafNO toxin-antitoxin module
MSNKTIGIALSALLTTTTLLANSDNMAESLMKLRAQVEQLDTQIDDEKDAYKASMKSLTMQKSELEAMVSREELKIKQIAKELAKVQEQIKKNSQNSAGLKPLVLNAADDLIAYIKTAIPFKTNDRVNAVSEIKDQLNADLLTPQKALSMVYNSYADELRMTKENGIFKQTINLNGEDKLAQIARVGTMMMFFKTPNDEVGYVTKENGSYSYKQELNKDKQEQIFNIFDAFKKQIRTGYFTLPNALVQNEVK